MTQGFQLQAQAPAAYERYLVPVLFAPCAERLLDLVAVEPGDRVLDVACGTGIVARLAAARAGAGGAVAGADVNEGMLEVAAAAAADLPAAIQWHRADAAALPLPGGAFDVVCCQQGLQYCTDQPLAVREARRVLAPGGRVAIAVWRPIDHHPVYAAFAKALRRHAGTETAALMHAPFAGPSRDELRRLLTDAGFDKVVVRIAAFPARFPSPGEFLRRQAASSPLGPPLAALDEEARQALASDLDQTLGEWTDDDGLVCPWRPGWPPPAVRGTWPAGTGGRRPPNGAGGWWPWPPPRPAGRRTCPSPGWAWPGWRR
jgi:ubiquinone/menaquinone biosynthesis C-methylase UbiE